MIFVSIEWPPYYAARELLGRRLSVEHDGEMWSQRRLEGRIRSAILLGELKAERRTEYRNGVAAGEDYYATPLDVLKWALDASLPVPPEYLAWYRKVTRPGKRGPKGGPRDETLYRVIAGLARAHGYKRNSKNDQGWMAEIITLTGLDRKTIKAVIDAALDVPARF